MAFDESIIVRMGLDSTAMERGLKGVKSGIGSLKQGMQTLGVGVGIGVLTHQFKALLEHADNIGDKAKELGTSSSFLQEFGFAATSMTIEVSKAEAGLSKLNMRVGEARVEGGEAAKLFKDFGIEINNTNGSAKSLEEVVSAAADAIKGTEDPQIKARIATELFGKSAGELIPLLDEGAEGMKRFKAAAAGKIITDETIDSLSEANAMLEELKRTLIVGAAGALGTIAAPFKWLGEASVTAGMTYSAIAEANAVGAQVAASAAKALRDAKLSADEAKKLDKAMESLEKTRRSNAMSQASDEGKLAILLKDQVDLYKKMEDAAGDRVRMAELLGEKEKLNNDILEQRIKIQAKLDKAAADSKNAKDEFAKAKKDRSLMTLEELANLDLSKVAPQRRGAMGQQKDLETKARRAERAAEFFEGRGIMEQGMRWREVSDRLRKGINVVPESETNPLAALERQVKAAESALEQLKMQTAAQTQKGVVVIQKMTR